MLKKIAAIISLVLAVTLLSSVPARAAEVTLTSVSPANGTVSGGTPLTLTGAGFNGATGSTIYGVAATNCKFVSDSSLTMTTGGGLQRQEKVEGQ
jgi:hypothetical protein